MSSEELARRKEKLARLEEEYRRLAPLFPDMDPGDLLLIIQCLLEAPEDRPFLLHEIAPGVYAP